MQLIKCPKCNGMTVVTQRRHFAFLFRRKWVVVCMTCFNVLKTFKAREDAINFMWQNCIDYKSIIFEVSDKSTGFIVYSRQITIDFRDGKKLLTYSPILSAKIY